MESKKKLIIPTERQKVLSFRLSPAEFKQIEARAQSLGLTVTQYVRSLALRDSVPDPSTVQSKPNERN